MTATRIADAGRHGVTVRAHRELRVGALDAIVTDVTRHLGIPTSAVREQAASSYLPHSWNPAAEAPEIPHRRQP